MKLQVYAEEAESGAVSDSYKDKLISFIIN